MIFNKKLKEEIKVLKEQLTIMVKDEERHLKRINELCDEIAGLERENAKVHKSNTNLGQKNKKLQDEYNAAIEVGKLLNETIREYKIENRVIKAKVTRLTNKLKTKEDIIQDFIRKGYNAGYINLLKQEDYEKLKKEDDK